MDFLNTPDNTNLGLMGLRVYGRLRNTAGAKWIDFGNIENLASNLDEQTTDITSARNGVRVTIKKITQSSSETYTFETLDIADETLMGLHAGSATLPITGGGSLAVRKAGASFDMEFAVLEPGAAQTDSMLLYIPRTGIKGNGKTPSNGTDAARIAFEVTVSTDEAYQVPATVIAAATPAPNGVLAKLESSDAPVADLEALLTKLSASLDAEGGTTP
ncbi:hypothetical protein DM785_02675 [Deinococcus actinosclerus]|nr:hypothetical protein DM785_02675 [Deinococcus actinosclerus]